MSYRILQGDVSERLRQLSSDSVHCVVTSPPYWGLRDYGVEGQIGLEATPGEFLSKMVGVFREIRRVLRPDGTCWVNMGDSYAGSGRGGNPTETSSTLEGGQSSQRASMVKRSLPTRFAVDAGAEGRIHCSGVAPPEGLKPKDLMGMPWRLAFALQEDGWWLRQDIIWSKPNPMPESVTDRCTKAHEYVFLLAKNARYYYDCEAIKEPAAQDERRPSFRGGAYLGNATLDNCVGGRSTDVGNMRVGRVPGNKSHKLVTEYEASHSEQHRTAAGLMKIADTPYGTRNKRSVWEIATRAFPEAHFATFPPKLVEPCILAGCPEGGTVLDPFNGAGTTGLVAKRLGRDYVGIELNPEYVALTERRLLEDAPLFSAPQEVCT